MARERTTTRFIFEGLEGVLVALFVLTTWPLSRFLLHNLGSTSSERAREWIGDLLVKSRHRTNTRGITIKASTNEIWPWLVQFGLGKAGFYSYELLERLVGIPVVNVEEILPDKQYLSVGDEILLHPTAPGVPVGYIEKNSHICFGKEISGQESSEERERSWSMYLTSGGRDDSRLLIRGCLPYPRSTKERVADAIEEPIDFIMEQRMLRSIKRLVESNASNSPPKEVSSR